MACFLERWLRPWQEDRTGTHPRPTWGRCLPLKLDAYRPPPSLSSRKLCLPPITPMGGGTAILVRRGVEHHALSVPGLRHLPSGWSWLVNQQRSWRSLSLSPSRPLIKSDVAACLSGEFPVLMAGNLNAKHVDWNSRLTALAWLRR
jgi:hypothetical protein